MTPYLRTIVTLARAVQARDPYAAGRSERVTRLAQRMAVELGLGDEHHHAIAVGVVCADIGKIGLPDRPPCADRALAADRALRAYSAA